MAALTKDRDTLRRDGKSIALGVATGKKIYKGSLVALDANGYAAPGATSTTLKGIGMSEENVDNVNGQNGDEIVNLRKDGAFRFENFAGADEITMAEIGNDCYIVDDQTVAKTNGLNTRSAAGKIFDVDADGVWVSFS
ncbi:hypothetical protein [Candidatus Magnetominusculus xianensis]|uniref:Phage tail protein n=1 Tax=Candidatus Magnetominusculus xianensis TaxID=1748249 RepID=A0ABR5SCL3_9BACT|nr:hypothetical protein [Candidatus Magnetominusculus xianensis]KWT81147.1 hypothetical protein ASN18_2653 [Candidatus Magnetominusculus xianensis]MBF0402977.1 hypothetical protein [Nitrospirota bacterium]